MTNRALQKSLWVSGLDSFSDLPKNLSHSLFVQINMTVFVSKRCIVSGCRQNISIEHPLGKQCFQNKWLVMLKRKVCDRINPPHMNRHASVFCCLGPNFFYLLPGSDHIFCNMLCTHFFNACQAGHQPNAIRPIGATDKAILCRTHHMFFANDGRHGIPIAHRLGKDCYVWFYSIFLMSSTKCQSPASTNLINDKRDLVFLTGPLNGRKKFGFWFFIANGFEHNSTYFGGMLCDQAIKRLSIIVFEGK